MKILIVVLTLFLIGCKKDNENLPDSFWFCYPNEYTLEKECLFIREDIYRTLKKRGDKL